MMRILTARRAGLLIVLVGATFLSAQPPVSDRYRGHFSVHGEATAVVLDPKGKFGIIGAGDGGICVFATDQKVVSLRAYVGHKKSITGAGFLNEAKQFATGGGDGYLRIWDTFAARKHHIEATKPDADPSTAPVPKPLVAVNAHPGGSVTAFAVDAAGTLIATASADGFIKIWNADGSALATIKSAHRGAVRALAFSPDGKQIVSGGADKSTKLWGADKDGKLIRSLGESDGPVTALAYSPDGKTIAGGSGVNGKSGSIQLWDAESGKAGRKLGGYGDVVTCVLFHPKTAFLAGGSADRTVRVWKLDDGSAVSQDKSTEPIRGLTMDTDATRFGTFTKTLISWWSGFGN